MNTPKLRFKDENEKDYPEWRADKIGNISKTFSGGTPSASREQYYGGNIPFIRSGEIDSDKTELFLTELGLSSSAAKIVEVGDILYALYGATSGEVSRSKIKGAINQAILDIKLDKNNDPNFIVQWFRYKKNRILKTYLQGGQGNLSAELVKKLDILLPSFEEQKKLGSLFSNLDVLIAIQRRKLNSLEQIKNGFLQKIFSQKIRFKDGNCNDYPEWKAMRLGDFTQRVLERNNTESDLPLTISAKYGLVDQRKFFSKQIASKDLSGYYIINNGDFAYNKSTSVDAPYGAIRRLDRYKNGAVSTIYICFKLTNKNIDSDFLVQYFKSSKWVKDIKKISAVGARNHGMLNISPNDFFNTMHLIPSYNEQVKISKFFNHFDVCINSLMKKILSLESIKRSLLQQMFI